MSERIELEGPYERLDRLRATLYKETEREGLDLELVTGIGKAIKRFPNTVTEDEERKKAQRKLSEINSSTSRVSYKVVPLTLSEEQREMFVKFNAEPDEDLMERLTTFFHK